MSHYCRCSDHALTQFYWRTHDGRLNRCSQRVTYGSHARRQDDYEPHFDTAAVGSWRHYLIPRQVTVARTSDNDWHNGRQDIVTE